MSSAPPPPSIDAVSLNDPVGVLAGSGSESDRPIAARIVSVHASASTSVVSPRAASLTAVSTASSAR